jgi:hypothetical protein
MSSTAVVSLLPFLVDLLVPFLAHYFDLDSRRRLQGNRYVTGISASVRASDSVVSAKRLPTASLLAVSRRLVYLELS